MGNTNPTQTAQYIAVLQGDGITLDVDRAIRGRARPGAADRGPVMTARPS